MIQLSRPYSIGDAGGPYTHVEIVDLRCVRMNKFITVVCQMGTLSPTSQFVPGVSIDNVTMKKFRIENFLDENNKPLPDYDSVALATGRGAAVDVLYGAICSYLIAEGHYEGTNTLDALLEAPLSIGGSR